MCSFNEGLTKLSFGFGRFYTAKSEKGYTDYPFSKEFLEVEAKA